MAQRRTNGGAGRHDAGRARSSARRGGGGHAAPRHGAPSRRDARRASQAQKPRKLTGEGLGAAQAAVAAKKRRRRRARNIFVLVLVLVLVAGVGLAFWLRNGVNGASDDLDQALALIEQSDVNIVAMDKAVSETVTADTVEDLPTIISTTYATQDTLDQALEHAQGAHEARWLGDTQKQEVADQAVADIQARKQMLINGRLILQADYDAFKASEQLSEAWNCITEADASARSSSATASAATTENMGTELADAIDEANKAKDSLSQASTLIDLASKTMQGCDFSTITAYITAKQAALDASIAADNAMLSGSSDDQTTALATFQEADSAAVTAAQAMPTDPTSLITDAYSEKTQQYLNDYESARQTVADCDVYIRDYLGVDEHPASALGSPSSQSQAASATAGSADTAASAGATAGVASGSAAASSEPAATSVAAPAS